MACIKFTITDNSDGTVRFVSDPPALKIVKMLEAGEKATGAHCMAFAALNALLTESKKHKKNSPIIIPRMA